VVATRNYRDALQAHIVAESAIFEAVQLINGPGVANFQNDIVDEWSTTYGPSRTFASLDGFEYTVSATQDATDPRNKGFLIATATGYRHNATHVAVNANATNRVVAAIVRSTAPPGNGSQGTPGAVYLANDAPVSAGFDGIPLVNGLLSPGNML